MSFMIEDPRRIGAERERDSVLILHLRINTHFRSVNGGTVVDSLHVSFIQQTATGQSRLRRQ